MKAIGRTIDILNSIESVKVGDHHFEFGGQGDGFCYSHQSFNCLDNLTGEEREAMRNIEWEDEDVSSDS